MIEFRRNPGGRGGKEAKESSDWQVSAGTQRLIIAKLLFLGNVKQPDQQARPS